jgi:hypothetical protein
MRTTSRPERDGHRDVLAEWHRRGIDRGDIARHPLAKGDGF